MDISNQSYTLPNISVSHQFPDNKQYTLTLTEQAQNGTPVVTTATANFSPIPTDVYSSTITLSQTWGISGSPYRIHGPLYIPQGVRLTLQPGVVLQFDAGYTRYGYLGIIVAGELVSQGQFSPTKEVYFTSANDNSPAPLPQAQQALSLMRAYNPYLAEERKTLQNSILSRDASENIQKAVVDWRRATTEAMQEMGVDNGHAGDWQGIQLLSGGTVTLAGAVIRYASAGVGTYNNSPITSPTSVTGGTFDTCSVGVGIVHTGPLTVSGNTFLNCAVGLQDGSGYSNGNTKTTPGSLTVSGNSFSSYSYGGAGIQVYGLGQDVTTSGNTFVNDSNGGSTANFSGTFGHLSFSGDHGTGGSRAVFNVGTQASQGGGITLTKDNTWLAQSGIRLRCSSSSMSIAAGSTLTLGSGAAMQFSGSYGIGILYVQGDLRGPSSGGPAYLTSYSDDTPYGGADGDSNNQGVWQGIIYSTGLTANLQGIIIRHALGGVSSTYYSVTGYAPANVTGGTFDTCSVGIGIVHTGALTVSGNTFVNCGIGLQDGYGYSSGVAPGLLTVSGNSFSSHSNGGAGIQVYGLGQDVATSGNTFVNDSNGGSTANFGGSFGVLSFNGDHGTSGSRAIFNLGGYISFGYQSLTLTKDNVWPAQSGIRLRCVSSSLSVAAGATLTLSSGVAIQFANSTFYVLGDLRGPASGGPAFLTGYSDDTPYGGTDGNATSQGTWLGVSYSTGLTANLQGIVIRHASTGAYGSAALVTGGTFDTCQYGVSVTHIGLLTVSGNMFLNCSLGILDGNGGTTGPLSVFGNSFSSGLGLQVYGQGRDVSTNGNTFVSDSTAYNGGSYATFSGSFGVLSFNGDHGTGGSRAVFNLGDSNGSFTLTKDNTWLAQSGIRLRCSGPYDSLSIAVGATLTLGSGAAIQFANSPLYVQGDLRGPSSGGPAYLTGYSDDTPYGGTDSDSNNQGIWQGVIYSAGLTANLQNISIYHANAGLSADSANLNGCNFTWDSRGVVTAKGGGVYRGNTFTGNGMAVQNISTTLVDARGNSWGDPSGPYNAKVNPNGKGNPISDYVQITDVAVPTMTTVSGAATPQGWTGAPLPLTVTLTPAGSTTGFVTTQTLTPAADGSFTISNVPAGAYMLGVKCDRHLQKDIAVDTTGGNISGLSVSLYGGDVNNDGVINGADISATSAAFRARVGDAKWNAAADVNGDGVINGADISLISANFRKRSDP